MDIAGQFILGLGLFFLGMSQVGSHMRHLSGRTFRTLVARSTGLLWEAAFLGTTFGALMQSPTAVTFILVSMVSSGLITAGAALPVIAWTNVGVTALPFIATLNIHPLVAYLVGLSAVGAALVRRPAWQAVAGVLLGVGLILFGLETMAGSAKPLVASGSFRDVLHHAVASPVLAFLAGVVLTAILQSRTAATLVIITLAGAGALDLPPALMLVYGTNLGAIPLRILLSAGLRGTPVQLVRFEDLHCLLSGVLMVVLFYAESLLGIPLISAAVTAVSPDIKTQLALGFLLSNFLPAVVESPFLGPCRVLLARIWPPTASEDAGKPKFITPQALGDPDTAMDLLERETARLLAQARALMTATGLAPNAAERQQALTDLSGSIDAFATSLASTRMTASSALRLRLLREELTVVGYLVDGLHRLGQSIHDLAAARQENPYPQRLAAAAGQLLDQAVRAAEGHDAATIKQLHDGSGGHGPLLEEIRRHCIMQQAEVAASERMILLKSVDQFELISWMVHRLSQLLVDSAPHALKGLSPEAKPQVPRNGSEPEGGIHLEKTG
jgi:phosphate:Na+ symporter